MFHIYLEGESPVGVDITFFKTLELSFGPARESSPSKHGGARGCSLSGRRGVWRHGFSPPTCVNVEAHAMRVAVRHSPRQ
jgi:hypothetical protein